MLYTAFIFGLISSFHCVGMCGPIAIMLPTSWDNPLKKVVQLSIYHVGKISTYGVLGLLFGIVGTSLFIAGFQQQVSIIVGVIIISLVLIPEKIINKWSITRLSFTYVGKVKSNMGLYIKNKSYSSFYFIGVLNGFLPCPMVYVALFGALAMPSLGLSFLYMIWFGLGTIPLLMAVSYFKEAIPLRLRNKMTQIIPFVAIAIGMLFIIRGLGLNISYLSPALQHLILSDSPACSTP
jgi:uncharacterized protein